MLRTSTPLRTLIRTIKSPSCKSKSGKSGKSAKSVKSDKCDKPKKPKKLGKCKIQVDLCDPSPCGLEGPSARYGYHAPGGYKKFQILTFVMFGLCAAVGYNAFMAHQEEEERPPFVPYEHLRKRTKRFPWNDDRSLFHNKHTNALPDGYED